MCKQALEKLFRRLWEHIISRLQEDSAMYFGPMKDLIALEN